MKIPLNKLPYCREVPKELTKQELEAQQKKEEEMKKEAKKKEGGLLGKARLRLDSNCFAFKLIFFDTF